MIVDSGGTSESAAGRPVGYKSSTASGESAYLALRIKSDGRRYTVNVQTDAVVETDIHQHRLYTRSWLRNAA
jgi:hypothetical protein